MKEFDHNEETTRELKLEKLAYRVLNLPQGSGRDDIRQAYLRLAMQYHPDKNPFNREYEKIFKNIQNAYDFLMKGRNTGKRNINIDDPDNNEVKTDNYNLENEWGYYLWWRDNFDM